MGVGITRRVWEHSRAKGADRLVLLAIAEHSNDDGRGAWPSVTTLARFSLLSDRQVRLSLRKLERTGELVTERGAGTRGTNLYRIATGEAATPEDTSGGKSIQGGAEASSGGGGKSTTVTPEVSSAEPEENPNRNPKVNPNRRGGYVGDRNGSSTGSGRVEAPSPLAKYG